MLIDDHFPLHSRLRPLPFYDRSRPSRPTIDTDVRFFPTPIPPSLRSCPAFRPGNFPHQTGRHRPPKAPYAKIPNDRNDGAPRRGRSAPDPSGPLAARMSHAKIPINPNSRRDPVGTPRILDQGRPERMEAQKAAHSRLNEKLGGEEMKTWLRSRVLQEGVMNMSVSTRDVVWLRITDLLGPAGRSLAEGTGYFGTRSPGCAPRSRLHLLETHRQCYPTSPYSWWLILDDKLIHLPAFDCSNPYSVPLQQQFRRTAPSHSSALLPTPSSRSRP